MKEKRKESVLRFSVDFHPLGLLEEDFHWGELNCQTCVVERVEGGGLLQRPRTDGV